MDAFEALLQDAPSTPAQSAADPFAALLAQPAGQPKAKPAAQLDAPPSFFQDVVVKSGKKLLSDAADVVDFGTVGIPSMVVAGAGEQMTRLQLTVNDLLGVGQKRTRREIAQEGAATAQRLQSGATPARNLLRTLGWLPEGPGSAEVLMEKVMEPVTKAAEGIEERTKNSAVPVLKEDVLSVVNGLFAAAGVKGAQFAGKRIVGKMEAKAAAAELKAWDAKQQATDAIQAESAKTGETGIDPTPVKTATNLGNAPIIESLTPEALKADKIRRKEVKREMRARFAEDRYDPARPDSPQAEAARVRGQEDRMPAEGQRFEMPRGYGPDPTMDWLRGGAAVGVGLSSLYALSEDNPEVAAAMAAGAFVLKGGKGLTLEAIKTMPDATPISRFVDQSAYILNTVEVLNKQSPGRFEFGKDSIAQLLKRDSVTKAEREILQGVLDATPGDTITAKRLMEGVKARTGDFELKRQESDSFADYGLDRIDRETDLSQQIDAEPWIPEGTAPDIEAQMRATHAAARADAARRTAEPTTTIYQSPVELGTANHFGDPNYFAHTRSFVEDGVKHVVELQSDVAQKAGKVLSAEEAKVLQGHMQQADAHAETLGQAQQQLTGRQGHSDFADAFEAAYVSWPENLQNLYRRRLDTRSGADEVGRQNFLKGALKELRDQGTSASDKHYTQQELYRALGTTMDSILVAKAEAQGKLQQAQDVGRISPMLKDWHKRLVREELAEAARQLAEDGPARERQAAGYAHSAAEAQRYIDNFKDDPSPQARKGVAEQTKYRDDMLAEAKRFSDLRDTPAIVRFADADTVAKVEGWAEESTTSAAKRAGMQDVWERDYGAQAPRILRQHESKLRREAGTDAAALAKIPRQMETAAANMKKARKYGKLFDDPDHAGLYVFYKEDVTKFLKQLGGADKVDSAGHGWWEVPVEGSKQTPAGKRVQQFGGMDADLAKAIATIGGGAWLASILSDPENKKKNAAWAAAVISLAMIAKSRISGLEDMAESAGRRLENAGGKISLELRNISQPLARRLLEFDMDEMIQTAKHTKAVAPFIKSLHKAGVAARGPLNDAILTGKPGPVLAALAKLGKPEIIEQWKTSRALLETLGKGLIDAGRLKQLLPDYYPRMVIDYPGLLNAIGVEAKTFLESMMEKENLKSLREKGVELSPLDQSLVVNKYLERAVNGQGKPGFLKRRSIEDITAELSPFYAPAAESLPLYIRAVVKEIERAKFFGKDLVRVPESGAINLDTSIGNLVNRELAAGRIKPEQVDRVKELLHSRFGPGERASSRGIQAFRNVTNAMLLGDIFSALRNLGDIGPIYAMYNGLSLAKSAAALITRNPERITAADMGMAKHMAEEFVHGTRKPVLFKVPLTDKQIQLSTARFADLSFKLGGFRFVDVGMKELAANTALSYYQAAVKKPRAMAEFRARYGEYFGKDFDILVADLQAKRKTRLTQMLATRELADLQPLFKSEMSKFYNDHPDGRVLYMLKSFTLSQINLVRDRGFAEIKKGNTRRGVEFLLRYTLLAGLMGMTADNLIRKLQGRDDKWALEDLPVHALKNFGWSQFALDKLRNGRPGEAALAIAAPPVQPIWDVMTGNPAAVRNVPVVGEYTYYRGMGGADKANYLEHQREKRQARDEADPEAAILRRRRAKEAFEKRVRESAAAPRP